MVVPFYSGGVDDAPTQHLMVLSTRRTHVVPACMPGARSLSVRAVSGLVASLWLLAVVVLYFEPALMPGLKELSELSRPGAPSPRHVLGGISHLAAAAAVFAAAWGIGRTLVVFAPGNVRPKPGTEEPILGFTTVIAVGLGVLSLLALSFSPIGLLRPVALWAIVVAGVVAAALHAPWRLLRWPSVPTGGVERAALALIAAAGGFALIGALAPEIEHDALWYHLPFPAKYLAAGSLVDFPYEYTSYYPMGTELIFGYALALDGPIAAKLVHFALGGLLVVATYDLGAQMASRRVGLVAAAILAVTPTVLWEATTAYIDLATAFFVALSLAWILRYADGDSRAALVLSALFCGLALNTKVLALIALVPLAAMAFAGRREVPLWGRLKASSAFAAIALLPPLPWFVRAELGVGNPVFPSLYWLFGADPARWTPQSAQGLGAFLDGFGYRDGPLGALALPWDMTMHGAAFGGSIGLAFLMLVPFALGTRRPPRALVLCTFFCLAYLFLWASPLSSLQMRFAVPVLSPLSVLAAVGFWRARSMAGALHRRLPVVVSALVLAVLVLSLPPFVRMHERDRQGWQGWQTHVLRETPLDAATGAEKRDAYLTRRLPTYAAIRRLNAVAGPRDRVVTFGQPNSLYSEAVTVPNYAVRLGSALAPRGAERAAYRGLRRAGVTYVLFERKAKDEQPALALTGPAFERRYLEVVYEDARAVLYRVREKPGQAQA